MHLANFVPPVKTFYTVPNSYDLRTLGNATVAPAGIEVYTSPAIPGWRNSLLMTAMISGAVFRMPLSDDPQHPVGAPSCTSRRSTDTGTSPWLLTGGTCMWSRMPRAGRSTNPAHQDASSPIPARCWSSPSGKTSASPPHYTRRRRRCGYPRRHVLLECKVILGANAIFTNPNISAFFYAA